MQQTLLGVGTRRGTLACLLEGLMRELSEHNAGVGEIFKPQTARNVSL